MTALIVGVAIVQYFDEPNVTDKKPYDTKNCNQMSESN
jgi:hypothetical protein